MSEAVIMRDYSIKLFGKTISLMPDQDEAVIDNSVAVSDQRQSSTNSETSTSTYNNKDVSITRTEHEDDDESTADPTEETHTEEAETSSEMSHNNNNRSKTLKKPDKIIPCPRCESSNTKFCYFNNYNVNQPRHFCKKCQRYWTDGGNMRKIPIGSGRRKSKKASIPDTMIMDFASIQPNDFYESNHPSGFGYSGFPVTFYPVSSNQDRAIHSNSGEHSREGKGSFVSNIPKSLKIHDPNEAAKSSIWSTLGYEKIDKTGLSSSSSSNRKSLFKTFESKSSGHNTTECIGRNIDCSSLVLRANPAALSRSHNFRESA